MNLLSLISLVAAGTMAVWGIDGWGWFLLAAVLLS